MGREVRRVPADWKHPKNERGDYRPLLDESFEEAAANWKSEFMAWENRTDEQKRKDEFDGEYWEYAGMPPDSEYYRPKWTDEERTHLQMYETVSEGTPISPPMETPEKLALWLSDNKASAGGNATATYEQWLKMIHDGRSISMVFVNGRMMTGVEFASEPH